MPRQNSVGVHSIVEKFTIGVFFQTRNKKAICILCCQSDLCLCRLVQFNKSMFQCNKIISTLRKVVNKSKAEDKQKNKDAKEFKKNCETRLKKEIVRLKKNKDILSKSLEDYKSDSDELKG